MQHCFIHHNQYQGLGYGVCLDEAETLIEGNLFDANRHSIAGTGRSGSGYEARHNVEMGRSLGHCFDMHGGRDRQDGTDVAGGWMHIHHNTFRVPNRRAPPHLRHPRGPGRGRAQLVPPPHRARRHRLRRPCNRAPQRLGTDGPGAALSFPVVVLRIMLLSALASGAAIAASTGPCADFDANGTVDRDDFALFVSGFGTRSGDPGFTSGFDLDGDERIDFTDFFLFASAFTGPGPTESVPATTTRLVPRLRGVGRGAW